MPSLADALRGALYERERAPRVASLDAIAAELGGNRGIAVELSGQTSGPEYKAALRRVQRWRTGATERRTAPRGVLLQLTEAAGLEGSEDELGLEEMGADLTITGNVTVSKDRRRRTMRVSVSGEGMADVMAAMRRRDRDGAAEALQAAIGTENGFGATPVWDDVEELTL